MLENVPLVMCGCGCVRSTQKSHASLKSCDLVYFL